MLMIGRCVGFHGFPARQVRHAGQCEGIPACPSQHCTSSLYQVQKIRDRQLAAPAESGSLQDLVLNELKTKKHTATEGLVWLVRYVEPFYLMDPTHTDNILSLVA